ncbi:hypothetical protein MCHIJ_38430 [Mycolicibacterium chitae]|uniref:Conserved protein of uncharacterized function, possibly exported n=1 Tax=Mycolicibacterium chitae TaxID=1792 RepID=A0A448I6X1_MYCCI|nr:hypothetical protein MCHIJ_38430 [Mycolicibacterium chitae]VEG48042.1 Conserved protein of uncharacterised function, possibly exported [Mycolicibacterium chitae]
MSLSRVGALLIALALLLGAPPRTEIEPATSELPLQRVAVISDSYTTGTVDGGMGPQNWTALAWQRLARRGIQVVADVAAEGRAGYDTVGNRGSVFADLTVRATRADDAVVVFFGSRNDQGVPPERLRTRVRQVFDLAQRRAPRARLLVIGPAWPTPDVPPVVLGIRDVLRAEATAAGGSFFDPLAAGWFMNRPGLIGPDGVHPTDAGHAYLAARIAPLIAARLPRPA